VSGRQFSSVECGDSESPLSLRAERAPVRRIGIRRESKRCQGDTALHKSCGILNCNPFERLGGSFARASVTEIGFGRAKPLAKPQE